MFQIETERLILRQLTTEDAAHMYELNLDPVVILYTGDPPFASVEAARDFLAAYDQYEKYGVGRWAVIRKEDQAFLGWSGLKYLEETNEYDVGYRFLRRYWNMGYATESAKAALNYGFNQLQLEEIVGRAVKENTASIRVLEKIGLTYWKDCDFHGTAGVVYRVRRG